MNTPRLIKYGVLSTYFLFLYAPIIVICIASFNNGMVHEAWTGFTWKWYAALWERSDLLLAIKNSFIVAIASAFTAGIISLLCIISLYLNKKYNILTSLLYSNIFVPEIIAAISLLLFFLSIAWPFGISTLIIAHTTMGIGYVFPLVYQRWQEFDNNLLNVSYDLGATQLQTIRYVIIPSLLPSLYAGSALVFILSLDDFVLAYFCSSSDFQTLPVAFLSVLRIGITPEFYALSTLILGVTALGIIIYRILVHYASTIRGT